MTQSYQYVLALEDFHRARQRAALEQLTSRLKGKSDQLLSYDQVRKQLKGIESSNRKLEEIPLDAIIGSVGRYKDFTRRFLPKEEVSPARWAGVMAATGSQLGLPPIEAYKIGEVYFVKDGNHRVSVARQMDLPSIQGYVTEIKTKVPLSPEDNPDSLILKAEYADFLEKTHLDILRPDVNLQLTAPGKYPLLEAHIHVHQYYLGIEEQRDIPLNEAVASFIDQVYLPTVEIIQTSGLLENFPNRTEADLYLWLAEYRANLEDALGMQVSTTHAALDLAKLSLPIVDKIVSQISTAVKKVVVPEELDSGPPVGSWRQNIADRLPQQRLFKTILVPVNGESSGWYALDQSLIIANRESSLINGLHVIHENRDTESQYFEELRNTFEFKCQQAAVSGSLAIQTGSVAEQIAKRSMWSDLLVVNLSYPPSTKPIARLASSIRKIVRQSFTPVLMVPRHISALEHALLAYDGSPSSHEALYLAAYLAGAWQIKLTILSVVNNHEEADLLLNQAREYLEMRSVTAEFIHRHGNVADDILNAAAENNCDWLLTGSYGLSPVLEIFWGSTLDTLLQSSQIPVMISR